MMTDQMNNTFDNAVEVHHRITIIPKVTPHRIDIVLQQEIELIMTEDLLLKIIQFPDMITINKVLDPIVLFINHTDHLTDVILVQERNHVRIQEATILQNILLHLHLLQDQESLDILDQVLTLIQEITLIQYNPNQQTTPLSLKYTLPPYRNG